MPTVRPVVSAEAKLVITQLLLDGVSQPSIYIVMCSYDELKKGTSCERVGELANVSYISAYQRLHNLLERDVVWCEMERRKFPMTGIATWYLKPDIIKDPDLKQFYQHLNVGREWRHQGA